MIEYYCEHAGRIIAEVKKGTATISTPGDMLDIMGDVGYKNCSRIIIYSDAFTGDFFNLGSGLAGEILQKFSNYRMKLAIVGDFTELKSKSWKDFIRESNRGRTISFVNSVEEAKLMLTKKYGVKT